MTRTSEPTAVTSEPVPSVAPHLSADRGYHGIAGTRHDSNAGFATDQPPAAAERITRIGTAAGFLRLDCTTGTERGSRAFLASECSRVQ